MNKKRILVVTKSTILAHLFDIFSHYLKKYEFFAIDQADMAYMMYQNGDFDMVIIDPLSTTDYSIDYDVMAIVKEIKSENRVPVIALHAIDLPGTFLNKFNNRIKLPFNPKEILSFLENNFETKVS